MHRETAEMISLIKRNSCGKALDAARLARDMLGGVCVYVGEGGGGAATVPSLLKMSCYSSITMCQYWDNWLIY